jgi:D-sedoheptulose 7-phosphate isomerase
MEIKEYFRILNNNLEKINSADIEKIIDDIYYAYQNSNTVFIIGNGGSAAKASHLAQDLSKGVIPDLNIKKRIKALSLNDNIPFITALANDEGYNKIFSVQLRTYAEKGDYLIAISGSGNSKNIIEAAREAKNIGVKVIGITGFDGGELRKISDLAIHISLNEMAMVESIHSIIFHYIINYLRMKITGDKFDLSCFY